eukprot:scaffold1376_cov257-Pinguiococcus_pyrenoidosus.AAC.29
MWPLARSRSALPLARVATTVERWRRCSAAARRPSLAEEVRDSAPVEVAKPAPEAPPRVEAYQLGLVQGELHSPGVSSDWSGLAPVKDAPDQRSRGGRHAPKRPWGPLLVRSRPGTLLDGASRRVRAAQQPWRLSGSGARRRRGGKFPRPIVILHVRLILPTEAREEAAGSTGHGGGRLPKLAEDHAKAVELLGLCPVALPLALALSAHALDAAVPPILLQHRRQREAVQLLRRVAILPRFPLVQRGQGRQLGRRRHVQGLLQVALSRVGPRISSAAPPLQERVRRARGASERMRREAASAAGAQDENQGCHAHA